MAKDYSGISASTILGGVSVGGIGQTIPGSLWSPDQLSQIDQTIDLLKQSVDKVKYSSIDQAAQNLKPGLCHPTWQVGASECVEAIYNLCPTVEGQAHIVAQLLSHDKAGHNFIREITNLLNQPDGSLLSISLDERGITRLLNIASQPRPDEQTVSLINWCREVIAPTSKFTGKYGPNPGNVGNQTQFNGLNDGPRAIDSEIIIDLTIAASLGDTNQLKTVLQNSSVDPTLAAQAVVERLGEDAKSALQELAITSSDARVRLFAFNGLMLLAGKTESPPPTFGGKFGENTTTTTVSNDSLFNLSSLKTILNGPGILPSSLASRIGYSSDVHACLLELIVQK